MKSPFVAVLLCCPVLLGFHGCLDETVHRQLQSTSGKRISYVDTRAGTGGLVWVAGENTPAVQVPLGMVKLGPDTSTLGKSFGTSGYYYGDMNLRGFSHTRLVGSGVYEGGILRVLPSNQRMDFQQLNRHPPSFSHRREVAIPGYYSLTLEKEGIQAELTATTRVGLHRYTFTKTNAPVLTIDLASCLGQEGSVRGIVVDIPASNDRITGHLTLHDDFSNRYGGLTTYFDIRLSTPFQEYRFVSSQETTATVPAGNPKPLYVQLQFAGTTRLELRTALSYTAVSAAANNLDQEAPFGSKPFDGIVEQTQTTWETLLGRIQVQTGNTADLQKFYTALFNSFRMPSQMGDYDPSGNETYQGFDGKPHTTTGFSYYSDFSLWDTFRTVHPLYLLIARVEQENILQSLLRMAQESGRFPRWAAGAGHVDSMLGFPASMVVAESYLKGLTTFDAQAAYLLLKNQATEKKAIRGRECFDDYAILGYCPAENNGSVSYTLEYAYADAALARLAAALGHSEDATALKRRSGNARNLWNSDSQAFLPRRRSGAFLKGCRLEELSYLGLNPCSAHYVEGSALQYRWYLAHSPKDTIELFSSAPDPALEAFFAKAPQSIGTAMPSGYYWHGNEPGLFSVVFFNYAGKPDRAQYWNDWIRRTKYDLTSVGLDGNDDGGTLSAWFVFSALGILPLPGSTTYEIVSPAFESATLDMGGNTFSIQSTGASSGKIYVKGATLNGVRLGAPRFDHGDISAGGTLVLEMSRSPSEWK